MSALEAVLAAIQGRDLRQRRARRLRALLVAVAVAGLVLGGLRWANLWAPPLVWVGPLLALGAGLARLRRRPRLSPLEAARLADARAGLAGLLSTALTLPERPEGDWAAALHARVRQRAEETAGQVAPAQVLPAPRRRVWAVPGALLALAGLAWALPPLPPRAEVARAAAVVEDQAPPASPPTARPGAASGAPIVNEPTPQEPAPVAGTGPQAPAAPGSRARATSGPERGGGAAAAPGPLAGAAPPARESAQPLGGAGGAEAPTATRTAANTQDTPFGSRETGQFQNQSVTSPDTLASAPYDPATAPGARPMQQKSDPGSTGLRAASGGRGIETDGADRCVQGCLTNSDMNRGAPALDRPKPPGGETTSGTSDSGSGAAGSSSGVGLGQGRLRDLGAGQTTQLDLDAAGGADTQTVLSAAEAGGPPSSIQTVSAAWARRPEAPPAAFTIPPAARETVRAYFERSDP